MGTKAKKTEVAVGQVWRGRHGDAQVRGVSGKAVTFGVRKGVTGRFTAMTETLDVAAFQRRYSRLTVGVAAAVA